MRLHGFCWRGLAVVLSGCFLAFSGLQAQSKLKDTDTAPVFTGSDRGVFRISSNGQVVGKESFQIVAEGNNFKASGETQLSIERLKEKVTFNIKASVQFTKNFEFISYQVNQEAGGNQVRARVKFKPVLSEVVYDTGKESDPRSIELKRDVMVLDDNVYHHYILLARRYDFLKGGQQEFAAFVPQQFMSGAVTIADKGTEQTEVGPVKMSLQHLLVDTGDLQINLWLDSNHLLKKISVPQSNVEVIRE
jgi:hypothetical protein